MLNFFFSGITLGCDYNAGYQIKIKLICRLTKISRALNFCNEDIEINVRSRSFVNL